jgi:glycosyltransferase involved in cell wall biosynthesis
MTSPTWTILIPTIGRRAQQLDRVLTSLLPQTEWYAGRVCVVAYWNNGERPLADIRQDLIECAVTDYVSFVDDDDVLPDYHVDRVMTALDEHPDYVGWRMQVLVDGAAHKSTFHSLRYAGWFEDEHGYYRDVSHLNPVRRDLAVRCDYRVGEPPEDVSWATQMRSVLRGKRECFIDDVMYYYHASSTDSTWRPGSVNPLESSYTRLSVEHDNFMWYDWSCE